MNQEIKKEWVEALRSGAFQQTLETIKDYDKSNEPRYCCLGVLLEIYAKSIGCTRGEEIYDDINNDEGKLSDSQLKIFSLTESEQIALIEANDEKGLSFIEIADVIESDNIIKAVEEAPDNNELDDEEEEKWFEDEEEDDWDEDKEEEYE